MHMLSAGMHYVYLITDPWAILRDKQ